CAGECRFRRAGFPFRDEASAATLPRLIDDSEPLVTVLAPGGHSTRKLHRGRGVEGRIEGVDGRRATAPDHVGGVPGVVLVGQRTLSAELLQAVDVDPDRAGGGRY